MSCAEAEADRKEKPRIPAHTNERFIRFPLSEIRPYFSCIRATVLTRFLLTSQRWGRFGNSRDGSGQRGGRLPTVDGRTRFMTGPQESLWLIRSGGR